MRKSLTLLAVMFIVSLASAQKVPNKEVPTVVKNGLQKQFPNAKNVKWEKEDGNYEAGFEINETDYSVLLGATGNIIETETEISIESLPATVKAYLAKHYTKQKIKEAAKIIDAKGTITYEAEVKGKDLLFDKNGNFIKQ
ncbi:MAG: PepSY-like domain-containing protein [Spirosomataceae bacterium]